MQRIILKILSGPMFGVDVGLPDDNVHLFFCDSAAFEKGQADSVYQYSLNTLLIPCAQGANEKIILRLTRAEDSDNEQGEIDVTAQRLPVENTPSTPVTDGEDPEDDECSADIAEPVAQHYEPIRVPLNEPVNIGHAVIALRPVSEAWSHQVTHYLYPLAEPDSNPVRLTGGSEIPPKKRSILFGSTLCAALCITGAALLFIFCSQGQVATLKDTLSTVDPAISQNINGKIYILTKTPPEAAWSQNALRKSNLAEKNIVILAETTEIAQMKKALSRHVIPFFDVKFTSPFTVNLLLSQERSAGYQNIDQTTQNILLKTFPYLKAVTIKRVSDTTVLTNAAERLASMGLHTEKDISLNHITFSISSEIDDVQLATLRRQVNEFYDQYGDQYIKFVVNLNEDPLRNSTFKTGPDSYVVVPGNHWLYSDIITTH